MKKTFFSIFFIFIISSLFSFNNLTKKLNEKEYKILINTSLGDIKLILYNETPQHRDNFVKLVNQKFFDGILFHRVIKNFMIQGGDPDSKDCKPKTKLGDGGPGYNIPAEFVSKYIHKRGALAAARESDDVNPKKESSGSQFYIVQGKLFTDEEIDAVTKRTGKIFSKEERDIYKTIGGVPHLDANYTVFGEVYEGIEVVDKIANVKTRKSDDRPEEDIKMTIKVIEQ
ncbi:MAG: peptidylprolyl isomerase [Bacteroidetes bacterium]|nr:peptidylprolyl isomerase [Bacteroidota bacterium]